MKMLYKIFHKYILSFTKLWFIYRRQELFIIGFIKYFDQKEKIFILLNILK